MYASFCDRVMAGLHLFHLFVNVFFFVGKTYENVFCRHVTLNDSRFYLSVMDGSSIAQIFPSKKFSALAHTIHANIHTDIDIIYPSTHTHHGPPRFVEMPVEKGKF